MSQNGEPVAMATPRGLSSTMPRMRVRLANAIVLVTMRCCPGSFYHLLEVYAIEAGMQDRVKLQARGEAQQACRDGKAN